MMRRIRTLLGVSALAAPSLLSAQAVPGSVTVSVLGGAVLPRSDMRDYAETGFTVGGAVAGAPSTLPVDLRVEVTYNRFGERRTSFTDPELGTFSGRSRLRTVNLTLDALIAPGSRTTRVQPYAIGGVGFYNSTVDIAITAAGTTVQGDDSKQSVGLNGGGGVRLRLGGISSFIEARYHHVFKGIPDFESQNGGWKKAGHLPIVAGITIGPVEP